MPIEIRMPALSPTMTEGNLARWLKQEGEAINPGDVIAEIETDKATMEVEAIDEGKLGKILVAEGTEGVAVNAVIGVLLVEGEEAAAIEGFTPGDGQAPAPAAEPTPAATAPAPATAPVPAKAGNGAAGGRIFASPLAKRMAEQAGIDLGLLTGSGPHGRIIKVDIERAVTEGVPAKVEPAKTEKVAAPAAQSVFTPAPLPAGAIQPIGERYDEIPLGNIRKIVARRLTESKQTIPHFYLTIDCALDALLQLRKDLNGRDGAGYKLSVNDFVIKAAALALKRVPDANASWGGDRIYRYQDVDVSVAVAIAEGLITPIVRGADQKGLGTISNEMKDLAARARENKLKPEEFQGGSFSISNLGMFGVREFAAVINPPQACILSVGAGEQRPVVKDGALATATMMSVTLSVDHRVVDGALGAQLLQAFKGYIEDPLSMLL